MSLLQVGNEEPPLFQNRDLYLEKPLPSSDESEKVILGAILLDNSVIDQVAESLSPEDFYSPFNRRVYQAMLQLYELPDRKLDPITIGEELKKIGSLESIGGVTAIVNLTFGIPHFTNVLDYIKVVKDKSIVRQLIRECNQITNEALSEETDTEVLLEKVETKIFALRETTSSNGFYRASELADSSVHHAQSIGQSGNVLTGLSTGFIDVDSATLGLQKTDLIIVAGRPSMGKTALGLSIAQNASIRGDALVVIFSLEMSKEQLIDRMICSEARIDSALYRVGMLSSDKWDRVEEARQNINHARIFIDDTPGISPAYIRPRLRRLKKEQGQIDLVLVDYIQLMEDSARRYESRQQEVTKISRNLKGIAKEFNVPLIAISQLNRQPEGRSNHKPIMSDLRESGAIEQDADVVSFVYRDDYYNENSDVPGTAEFIIAKQRNGPTGSKMLSFDKPSTRFDNLSSDF